LTSLGIRAWISRHPLVPHVAKNSFRSFAGLLTISTPQVKRVALPT
jgi:hypothetical protein